MLVSVPSSSGHSLQHDRMMRIALCGYGFSPLFIGALSSTRTRANARPSGQSFQSPLHRGTLFNIHGASERRKVETFQSPLHRGTLFNQNEFLVWVGQELFQSPLHRGTLFNVVEFLPELRRSVFQSPLHRGTLFNAHAGGSQRAVGLVSVPSSSGHSLQPTSP